MPNQHLELTKLQKGKLFIVRLNNSFPTVNLPFKHRYGPGASVANQINPDEDPQPFDVIYNVNTIDPAHITSGSVGRGWTSTMGIDTCPVDRNNIYCSIYLPSHVL